MDILMVVTGVIGVTVICTFIYWLTGIL